MEGLRSCWKAKDVVGRFKEVIKKKEKLFEDRRSFWNVEEGVERMEKLLEGRSGCWKGRSTFFRNGGQVLAKCE